MRHTDIVSRARFSPDGSVVLTASNDKTARLWSALNTQPLGEPLRHPNEVEDAALSPDGRLIATASGLEIRLWDARERTLTSEPGVVLGVIKRLEFNPTRAASLALMLKTGSVVLWDCEMNSPYFDAPSHGDALDIGRVNIGKITSFNYSPDGMWLGTTGNDGTARVWRPDMTPFGHPAMRHDGRDEGCAVRSISFDQSGIRVATGGADGQACVWALAANIAISEPASADEIRAFKDKFAVHARHEGRLVDTEAENLTVIAADGLAMSGLLGFDANGAAFARDGNRVLIQIQNQCDWHDVPFVRAPEWIHAFALAISGAHFLDSGELKLEPLAARLNELEKVRVAIACKDDPWAKLARWEMTAASARTVSPLALLTTPEVATGVFQALDSAANADLDQVLNSITEAQCHVPDHPFVPLKQALLHTGERSATLLRIGLRRLIAWVARGKLERSSAGRILSEIEAAWPGQLHPSQLRMLGLTDTETQQVFVLVPSAK